jgi:hypothetical protein
VLGLVAGCILVTWVVCAVILIGVGSLLLRNFSQSFHLTDAFWTGLAASVAFLEFWNLFRPVTAAADLLLAGFGVLGVCMSAGWLRRKATEVASRKSLLIVFAVLAIGIALRAAGPCEYYDTGLYGAQAVRWIRTYPAVFGLANLHARLGIRTAVFVCHAALDQGPWRDIYFHLFAGLILCGFWVTILPACRRVLQGVEVASSDWFHAILVIPALIWSSRASVVGTTTDEPTSVLCLIAAGLLSQHMQRDESNEVCDSDRDLRVVVAAILLALAVTFKLSAVVFAFLGWCLAFAILRSKRGESRYKWAALGGAAAIVVPWLVGQIILSGYPLFPSSWLPFPVDWRLPPGVAEPELRVLSWARIPFAREEMTQGYAWLRPWIHTAVKDRAGLQVPMAIAAVATAILGFARLAARPIRLRGLWLLLPSLGGILFWFWKAPDLRFGQAAIWTLAATLGSLGITTLARSVQFLSPRVIAAGLLIPIAWCLLSFGWRHSYQVLESVDGFVRLPEAAVVARQTVSGLTVYAPANGNQCWDAALLCTPYFNKTLRLRSPSKMRWGFTSEGFPELPEY